MAKHSGSGKSGGPYGPGGVHAAYNNPNKLKAVNDAPCGPYAHCMGYEGDAGMKGNTVAKHRGTDYWFK